MADKGGYIGRSPGDSAVIIARQNYSPTGIQTDFTFNSGYTPGYVDVYLNGVRLIDVQDYTASTGNTVGLTSYANNGDIVEVVAYKAFNVGNVSDATSNFTVGGNLTVSGDSIVSGGSTLKDLHVTGVSTLSGASYLADVTEFVSSGIVTVSNTTDSTSSTTGALLVNGGVGVALSMHVGGNLSVGGTLTYEDVTNVDAIGIITAQSGVNIVGGGLTCVGVATFFGVGVFGGNVEIASGTLHVGDEIAHYGDTDTNIGFPSADTFAIDTAGSERLRITSTGRVGIGSIIPQTALDVFGEITLPHNNTLKWVLGTTIKADIYSNSGGSLIFRSSSSEKFRIGSTGDVTLTSAEAGATGPTLKLTHNSASPADNDIIGVIAMDGDDDAGNATEFSSIYTKVTDVSNSSETGHLAFKTRALSSYNEIFRLAGRSSASAPSYTTDDINGIILDVYNTGNPYPRYMNFIAKSGGDTDTNISFWTEAVGGSPTEKLRITSAGKVLVGGTSAVGNGTNLEVLHSSSSSAARILAHGFIARDNYGVATNIGNAMYSPASNTLAFATDSTERLRIDASGRLLVGAEAARTVFTSYTPALQIEGLDYSTSAVSVINNSAGTGGPSLWFGKSRGTSDNTNTIVQSGDELGTIVFNAADGTDIQSIGALIKAEVDGTPGENDTPGRLSFRTTVDGGSSPTERLLINNAGQVRVLGTQSNDPLYVRGGTGSNASIRLEGGDSGADNSRIESKYNLALACNGDGNISGRRIYFYNGSTSLMEITPYGDVGINSATPADPSWGTEGNTKFLSIVGSTYGCISLQGSNGALTKWTMGSGDGIFYMAYDENTGTHVLNAVSSTKNVHVLAGNLVIGTADKGIDFSADSNAGNNDSELFNDYEEGRWTPTLGGTSGDPTQSYATQVGSYTRIGNIVHVSCDVQMASSGVSAGSGNLLLGSLPYNKGSASSGTGSGQTYGATFSSGYNNALGSDRPTAAYIDDGNNYLYMMKNTPSVRDYCSAGAVTNSTRIIMGATYRVA